MKKIKSIQFLTLGAITLTLLGTIGLIKNNDYKQTFAVDHYPVDVSTYYNGISGSGTSLLGKLQSLNKGMKRKNVGYSSMGTSPTGMFKYTDYDPSTVVYDSNGQPYGTKILSFYSGKSTTGWNREHVWPDSRGGGSVDSDIFMPRPTISSENSNRGNSSYVTGMAHSANGWDPVKAFADNIGVYDSIRGECARIIFYCAVANPSLKIKEGADMSYNNSIGDLISLLEWHVDNPINEREVNRNNGGQYLQGNRNPFVDHPEYVCQVWGNTNDKTRSICSKDPYVASKPTDIELNTDALALVLGSTQTLFVKSVTPESANKNVTWESSNPSVATITSEGVLTGLSTGYTKITATSVIDTNVKAYCNVTVIEPQSVKLESITATAVTDEIYTEDTTQINIANYPEDSYPIPTYTFTSSDNSIAKVDSNGLVTGVSQGKAIITATATQNSIVKTDTVDITVIHKQKVDGQISITRDSFSSASGSYNWYNWSNNKVSGQGYIYAGKTNCMQFNKSDKAGRFFNEVDVPGNIYSVSIDLNKDSDDSKDFELKTSDKVFDKSGSTSGTVHTYTGTTKNKNLTIDTSGAKDSYFYLRYTSTSGVCYVDSIDVNYVGSSSTIPVEGCSISNSEISLIKGGNFQLNVQVLPVNSTNKNVSWSSNNTSSATVSNTGLVTAIAPGSGVITVTTEDGGFTDTCSFVVSDKYLIDIRLNTAKDVPFKEEPNITNYTFVASYNDESESIVNPTSIRFADGFDSNSLGQKKLLATYSENSISKTCEFFVDVTNVNSSELYFTGEEQASATIIFIKKIGTCYSSENKISMKQAIIEYNAMIEEAKLSNKWNETFVDTGEITTSYLNKIIRMAYEYNLHVDASERIILELPVENKLINLNTSKIDNGSNNSLIVILISFVSVLTGLLVSIIVIKKRKTIK
ncbi:MAG: Ig-like domain-containing protein [Bacilli bacterium]|nr:Ig-like domain-containing protein [Bacilli bacterium]